MLTSLLSGKLPLLIAVCLLTFGLVHLIVFTLYDRRRLHAWKKKLARSQALARRPRPSPTLGRRVVDRREGNPTPVFLAQKEAPDWQTGAWVLNRSEGGLRLLAPQPFEKGAALRVLSSHAPNNMLWAEVEVRYCRPGKDGWELGCQFSFPHPRNILLLFG